jgi:oxygen-independent coproporphyrinogen-3 oxidase
MNSLIEKYNVPVPRYTSYPTVPNWNNDTFSTEKYTGLLEDGFAKANASGIALYIHLPFCESLCTYCGCNTRITVNHLVEEPYIDALLAEWKLYLKLFGAMPLIKELHLGGGTPTFFSAENLKRLLEGITSHADVASDAAFSFEAHPANTTKEHLATLFDYGFDRLSLGIQDFDPVVQKAINRRQTPGDVERVVLQARAIGYRSVNFDLIYGLPFQSKSGVINAIQHVAAMKPDRIAFYSYAHVPWLRPGQRAYSESDLPSPHEKLTLFSTGRNLLTELGYHSIGFDHFALPGDSLYKAYEEGKVHRNFMGYTDQHTEYLIGLGVSAISDIGGAFAQNAKVVEAYAEKVMAGQLPVIKGHILDREEMFIRKHILNITCKQFTTWADATLDEQNYMRMRARELDTLIADGIVTLHDDSIHLTESGRTFSRNVCAVFDKYYAPQLGEKMYSQAV